MSNDRVCFTSSDFTLGDVVRIDTSALDFVQVGFYNDLLYYLTPIDLTSLNVNVRIRFH